MEIYAEWCGEYRCQYATVLTYSKLPLQGIGPALACVTGVKMGGEERRREKSAKAGKREGSLSFLPNPYQVICDVIAGAWGKKF